MRIIELMKLLGYSPDEGGVCYGIAFTAVQAALGHLATDSTSLFKQFLHRAKSIQAFSENDKKILSFLTHIWHSDQARDQEQKQKILNIEIKDITFGELLAFCDTVLLYQGVINDPNNDKELKDNLGNYLFGTQDYQKAAKLFATQAKDNQKEIFAGNDTVIGINDKTSFTEFLKEKKESQEFVLTVQRPRHRMALVCHDEKWHLIDHDEIFVEEAVGKFDKIYERLKQQGTIGNSNLFNVSSYSNNPNVFINSKYQSFLKDIIQSEDRIEDKLNVFVELVKKYITSPAVLKKIFLGSNYPEGNLFLQMLKQQKDSSDQEFKSYLEGCKSLSIGVSDLLRCLAVEDDNKNNQIQNALQNNHSFVLSRIIKMLKLFDINEQALKELKAILTHENNTKQNTLSIIVDKNDSRAFGDYLELIKRFDLNDTSELDKWLIYKHFKVVNDVGKSKEINNDYPVMFWALKEGLSDIVETMLHKLNSFTIDNHKLKTLLVAKKGVMSGLFMALYHNRSEAVKVFLSGVKKLNLGKENLKEMLSDMLSKLKLPSKPEESLINNKSVKVLVDELRHSSLANSDIKEILPLQLYDEHFSENIQVYNKSFLDNIQENNFFHLLFKEASAQQENELAGEI